jgi:hypothetical protein
MKSIFFGILFSGAYAFPWVSDAPGVSSPWGDFRKLKARQQPSPDSCPFNANHKPANPITSKYPYNGAKNGLPGKGKGGYQVPANVGNAHFHLNACENQDLTVMSSRATQRISSWHQGQTISEVPALA